jgi:phosphatidylglycerol:prolipoprotein diacylglycerol transferase
MLALAMIQHPLLTLTGAFAGLVSALLYVRWQHMPLFPTADALAAPLALGLAFEQFGALLAGSGFGTETQVRWSVTYTDPLAARWSGTPLFVPLHPVQAYAALSFLTLSAFLLVYLPVRRQSGDIAGVFMLATGLILFLTELYRDTTGRGPFLNGALDGPQLAAIVFVLAGGWCLREHRAPHRSEAAHA